MVIWAAVNSGMFSSCVKLDLLDNFRGEEEAASVLQ